MQNMNLLKSLLWTAVGCLSVSACSLPAPAVPDGGLVMKPITCAVAADAGAVDAVSTVIATGDVENVVMPEACGANPTGNAIDKYSQGYGYDDPQILAQLDQTMASISPRDEMFQMGGMPYGSSSDKNYNDIQRSQDTGTIRGFRYRDASRGMNLGEDMDGLPPPTRLQDRQARPPWSVSATRPSSRSAWPAARPSISTSSTRSARRSATRCRPPSRRCCSRPA